MNNNTEITLVDGSKLGLCFGMIANEEFMRLIMDQASQNVTLQSCNIIYAGAYNYAVNKRTKSPDYEFIVDQVEELYTTEEGIKQISDVYEVFNDSRFGKNLLKSVETIKKKAEELNSSSPTSS